MEAKDELAVLFRELPLKAGDEPEVRYRMEAYRPELFGSPSPAPGYCVNKVVQKNTGRRTVYSLVETCQSKGGALQTLRFGAVFEIALRELVRRYPEVSSPDVFDFTEEGKSAGNLYHLLSAWADCAEKLSFIDILKGASRTGCQINLDYSQAEKGGSISGRLYSLECSVIYPLLFAAELIGSVRIQKCKLCQKPFICFEPNRRYCHRMGEEESYPELSCEEARKRIASTDSNYRRQVERKIKKIREGHEQHDWSNGAYRFEEELAENRRELKGNPRKNERLLEWLVLYENGLTAFGKSPKGLN